MTTGHQAPPTPMGRPLQAPAQNQTSGPPGQQTTQHSQIEWGKIDPNQDFQIPVTEFVGTLAKVYRKQSPFQTNEKITYINVLEFENCRILASDEPYPYNKIMLQIKDSNRISSGWGVFQDDLRGLFGFETLDELAQSPPTPGMRFWLCLQLDRVFFRNSRKQELGTGSAWRVMKVLEDSDNQDSITGVFGTDQAPTGGLSDEPFPQQAQTGISVLEHALNILHGKTNEEFYSAAINDVTIKTDTGIMMQINGQTFINTQVAAGRIGENQGRFYKIS